MACRPRPKSEEKIEEIDEMEQNLQYAINDLIEESEDKPKVVSQQVTMIITHLAAAAADLRIKKQQKLKSVR